MARESKAKRDARRFGRPERLADYIIAGQLPRVEIAMPIFDEYRQEFRQWEDKCKKILVEAAVSKVIDATNVYNLVQQLSMENKFTWSDTVINARAPFPACFVEMDISPQFTPQIRSIGWAIEFFERGDEPQIVYDFLVQNPDPEGYEKCKQFIVGTSAVRMLAAPGTEGEGIIYGFTLQILMLDDDGNAVSPPAMMCSGCWKESGQFDWVTQWSTQSFAAAMMAFCFMNCSNVTVKEVQPDQGINRERRKVGLKPLVRYNTIQIDSMVKTLKTEGDMDANGIHRAFHICRGHMVRRTIPNEITYWRSTHVRGSAKEGIIISDYRVNPPQPPTN